MQRQRRASQFPIRISDPASQAFLNPELFKFQIRFDLCTRARSWARWRSTYCRMISEWTNSPWQDFLQRLSISMKSQWLSWWVSELQIGHAVESNIGSSSTRFTSHSTGALRLSTFIHEPHVSQNNDHLVLITLTHRTSQGSIGQAYCSNVCLNN